MRAVRGGRRARHVRGARARRPLRRLPDPRADRLRRRLRAGGRADVPRAPSAAAPRTPRCGSRAARRSTATSRVHAALAAHERRINADVEHPAMRALALPYPVSVGRVEAGEWSSSVPDRLVFEGRVGVRVGEDLGGGARRVRGGGARGRRRGPAVEIAWTGGAFAPGETDPDAPVGPARAATRSRAERGAAGGRRRAVGRRHAAVHRARHPDRAWSGRRGIELAHAVDERVRIDELAALARIIARASPNAPTGARDDARRRQARPASRAAASAASSCRSTRSRPRSQKPGSARSMPTIRPSSSGGIEPPAASSSR